MEQIKKIKTRIIFISIVVLLVCCISNPESISFPEKVTYSIYDSSVNYINRHKLIFEMQTKSNPNFLAEYICKKYDLNGQILTSSVAFDHNGIYIKLTDNYIPFCLSRKDTFILNVPSFFSNTILFKTLLLSSKKIKYNNKVYEASKYLVESMNDSSLVIPSESYYLYHVSNFGIPLIFNRVNGLKMKIEKNLSITKDETTFNDVIGIIENDSVFFKNNIRMSLPDNKVFR